MSDNCAVSFREGNPWVLVELFTKNMVGFATLKAADGKRCYVSPKLVVKNGDESHGIEPIENQQQNKSTSTNKKGGTLR